MKQRVGWMGLAACLSLACLLCASHVGAQESAGDKAAAQVLFDEARELLEAENYERACPKFEESMRLDPALGTQLNLARCYQLQGKTASAWVNYVEAASKARRTGQTRREEIARKFADELRPTLSKMTIEVPRPVHGMEVRRGGALVREAQWGSKVPVDPGQHEIVVTAPGYYRWSTTVKVGEEADDVTVTVAELKPAPKQDEQAGRPTGGGTSPPDEAEDHTAQLAIGVVAGVLGLGGITVGVIFGVMAMNDNDESMTHCLPEDPNRCYAEGVELRDDAMTESTVSTVGFIAGGVLLVAGVVVLATMGLGDDEPAAAPEEPGAEEAGVTDLRLLPLVGFEPATPAGLVPGTPAAGLILRGRW